MRRFARKVMVGLAVLSAMALMVIPQAFAGFKSSLDQPPGEPPKGLATQGDAGGTKLYGVITIEYFNIQTDRDANYRVIARMRKNNDAETFYVPGGNDVVFVDDSGEIQRRITPLLSGQLLARFFPKDRNLCTILKNISEIVRTPNDVLNNYGLIFDVADIEVAVSPCNP